MNYDDAIEAMRNREVEAAPLEAFRAKQAAAPAGLTSPQLRTARLATAVAVAAFVLLGLMPALRTGALWMRGHVLLNGAAVLPVSVLVWAFRRAPHQRLGAQFMCRAVWWSSLVVGVLVSMNYRGMPDKATGAAVAIACAVALRAVGETGLDVREPDHPFAPIRFRGHLLLALVMASADALTLSFSGLIQTGVGMNGWSILGAARSAGPTLIAAVVMATAVWGVYRLRTWALFLNLVANIAIAYLAMDGSLGLSPSVSVALSVTAAIQCFIPVPILAVALGDRDAGQPLLARARRSLMLGATTFLAGMSVLMIVVPMQDGWVDGPGRAFVRGAGAHQPAVRARLHAVSDDLRGRVFDGKSVTLGEFSWVNLEGASMRRVHAVKANFNFANLRGVDFTRATLVRDGFPDFDPIFVGADVRGADFTGATMSTSLWSYWEPRWLDGVTCPDGTPADARTGCEGRLGHVPAGFRKVMTWERTSVHGSLACAREGESTIITTAVGGGLMTLRDERFVRLADGRFVSRHTVIVEDEHGRWHVDSGLCGENWLNPVEQ